jgi:HEAT repeat protein
VRANVVILRGGVVGRVRALIRNPALAAVLLVAAVVVVYLRVRSLPKGKSESVADAMRLLRAGGIAGKGAPGTLHRMGAAAVPALVADLKDSSPEYAARCAEVLGRIGDRSAAPALAQAVATGAPPLKGAAATALGEIGASEACDVLVKAARDGLPEACTALGALHPSLTPDQTKEAAGTLLQAAGGEDAKLDRAACLGLAALEWRDALPALRIRLDSPDAPVWVAEACVRLGDGEALDKLARHLDDEDADSRTAAGAALVAVGEAAIPVLRGSLASDSPSVRAAAATALAELHDQGAKDALLRLLSDESPAVVRAAADALAQMRFPDAVEPLAKALAQAGEARLSVAKALGSYGEGASSQVIELLKSKDPQTVQAALMAAREGEMTAAVPAVTALLTSADTDIARAAATALGIIGDRSAVPALRQAAVGDNPRVAFAAKASLRTLGEE